MMKENIKNVEQRIQAACDRVGRKRSEITLIAVSKTKPLTMIKEAYALGMRHFGENKVQELAQKFESLLEEYQENIYWHQIGHLQRNKVKYVVDKAVLIHSVDSLRLALQIEEEASKKGIICDVLIEVNIASEETKFGVASQEVLPLIMELDKLSHIRVRGLMTVAPYDPNPEQNRTYFRNLRELYVDIKSKNIDNRGNDTKVNFPHENKNLETTSTFPYENNNGMNIDKVSNHDFNDYFNILSMGMTGDYEVAIEEGATMVRIGTGIFGERNYNDKV